MDSANVTWNSCEGNRKQPRRHEYLAIGKLQRERARAEAAEWECDEFTAEIGRLRELMNL
ncbi:MAG TPA: hypothetical protein VFH61_13615 [Thermoleophilia bacterium]|nr:hypothetical protein [Thermoleophilia bacterium]